MQCTQKRRLAEKALLGSAAFFLTLLNLKLNSVIASRVRTVAHNTQSAESSGSAVKHTSKQVDDSTFGSSEARGRSPRLVMMALASYGAHTSAANTLRTERCSSGAPSETEADLGSAGLTVGS